jgi:hypothetical protein
MNANAMIAALQAAVASNGGNDLPIVHQVSAAHAAGDKMSSVSSVIFVGATVLEGPGAPTTQIPAVVNVLLP